MELIWKPSFQADASALAFLFYLHSLQSNLFMEGPWHLDILAILCYSTGIILAGVSKDTEVYQNDD